ncbi:hypothetical protein [Bradyrhizobium sp.]|jgi:hypothetical protein|uniref:hypothetical protein n=1 Tax=Bradyrhizobium sp. TaxID=376 RepID=UPI003C4A6367
MEIESQSLTACEVAPDGNTVVLGFTDSHGKPAHIRLSLNQIGALAMTLPDLINKALRSRYGDDTLRYAYPLASWTVERSSDPRTGMITLSTTDGFSVCFSVERELRQTLATALASDDLCEPYQVMN